MKKLSIAEVFRGAIRTYRRNWWYLTLLAAVVETPLILLELAVQVKTDISITTGDGLDVLWLSLPMLLWGSASHHFLSGMVEGLEAAERLDHHRASPAELFGQLPWLNILAADLVLTVLSAVGFALLVVPGIMVVTYFAIVLPLVNFERRSVLDSFRRSYQLTRPHFWRVLAVVASSTLLIEFLQQQLSEQIEHASRSELGDVLGHLIPNILFLPITALPVVILMFELVRLDAEADVPATSTTSTSEPSS